MTNQGRQHLAGHDRWLGGERGLQADAGGGLQHMVFALQGGPGGARPPAAGQQQPAHRVPVAEAAVRARLQVRGSAFI